MSQRALQIIELCHQKAHAASVDPEDYVFVALTQREIWLMLLGAVITAVNFPCLEDDLVEYENKVGDAIHVQKPAWRGESDD